ncbi:hypothetical protein [Streptomyces sp. URMC 123]|uniref:hypothetical protein n=1 Tax=Streptomyces sp. URMC 123 TaxID=3423403 RepID=UPI003F1B85D2
MATPQPPIESVPTRRRPWPLPPPEVSARFRVPRGMYAIPALLYVAVGWLTERIGEQRIWPTIAIAALFVAWDLFRPGRPAAGAVAPAVAGPVGDPLTQQAEAAVLPFAASPVGVADQQGATG